MEKARKTCCVRSETGVNLRYPRVFESVLKTFGVLSAFDPSVLLLILAWLPLLSCLFSCIAFIVFVVVSVVFCPFSNAER